MLLSLLSSLDQKVILEKLHSSKCNQQSFPEPKVAGLPPEPKPASHTSFKNPSQLVSHHILFWATWDYIQQQKWDIFGAYTAVCWPDKTFIQKLIFRDNFRKVLDEHLQNEFFFQPLSDVQVSINLRLKIQN